MRDAEYRVLHSDGDIVVVEKAAGVAVIPERQSDPRNPPLRELLAAEFGKLYVVHRIDKETSGVLVFARTKKAHAELGEAFAERRVSKVYHAFVSGAPEWAETECAIKLHPDGDREHRTVVDQRHGRECFTAFARLAVWGRYALVEARPRTGRTHQIRAHLAALGHPILCDSLYGSADPVKLSDFKPGRRGDPFDERPLLSRLGLHALSLELPMADGRTLRFESEYPKDFRALKRQLELRYGGAAPKGGATAGSWRP